jgi:hypothetical protein
VSDPDQNHKAPPPNAFGSIAPPQVWPKDVAEDKRTIRDVELVASDRADYAVLGELEIPISEPAETMEAGERVLRI